jgi:hypothetical protein
MLTNDRISEILLDSGHARLIAGLFLTGVILQVVLAAVNKTAMWICYFSADEEEPANGWWCKAAHWVSKQYWFDLLMDLGSLAAFAVATWYAFDVLIKA